MCLCLQRFIAQWAKNGKTYFNKIYKIVQQNIREITQIATLFLYTVHCKPKSANRANVRQEMP